MITPPPHTNPSKLKLSLLNWACIFPGVLLLNMAVQRLLGGLHLPEWVLAVLVTGVLTFGIVYFIGPWLERTFRGWLQDS